MTPAARTRIKTLEVERHLHKLRPEMRTAEIASYLGTKIEIDDDGNPTTDVGAMVAGWAAENPGARAADAPAAKPAAAPAREIPASGPGALRAAVVSALMAQANPPKSSNGGP